MSLPSCFVEIVQRSGETLCRHGDSLRGGWKNLLSCIMRLCQLDLLPPVVLLLESDDPQTAKERLPRPSASRRTPASASLLSRAFSRSGTADSPLQSLTFQQDLQDGLVRVSLSTSGCLFEQSG